MKFILADPYLTDYSGHCHGYLQSLRHALNQRGAAAEVVGNASMSAALTAKGAIPIFSPETMQPVRRKPFLARLFSGADSVISRSFNHDLGVMNDRFSLGTDDVVLINSVRQAHMLGLARWIESVPAQARPWTFVVFHYTTAPNGRRKSAAVPGYSASFRRLRAMGGAARCVLMADTDELVDEFKALSGLPVLLAPIPHTLEGPPGARSHDRALQVSFIGQARPDKGFDLLPQVAASIQEFIAHGQVRFCVQSATPGFLAGRYDREIADLESCGATLFREALGEDDYRKLILDSDVVLLPYTQDTYYRQSSGVFAEAVASGKVIVAPRGTWMGRQLREMDMGVVYDDASAGSLVDAVRQAIDDFARLSVRARAGTFGWARFHNAQTFLSIIESAAKIKL